MKRNVGLNFFVGTFSQILILALGFVVPRIILTHHGSDTNGLINTITQIFAYMALIEAGIGQAAQNELYPYVKRNDKKGMSLIMSVAGRYYRKIAGMYAGAVLILAIVLPFVLKTNVNYFTVSFYIFFEGLTALVGFYYTSTFSFFLFANGRTYVVNSINLLVRVLGYGVKIILVIFELNIVFIQIGYFVVSLIQLALYQAYMKKNYGWIDYNAVQKDFKLKDRNAYVITEIAGTVFSSTDMIVLSIFMSTAISSVYSTYNMVFIALQTLLEGAYNSLKYVLGQTYHVDMEKYKKVHDIYNSVFVGGMTILVCVAYLLIIPFVKIYTRGVNDINYFYTWLPLCFCLVQLLSRSRSISGNLTGVAGYAKPVSYISCIEAVINIVLSIVLVQFWGIYGVLIATVCALPIKVLYVNYIAEKKIMKRSPGKTIRIFLVNYMIFGITVLINCYINLEISSFTIFVFYGVVFIIIYTGITVGANILVNRELMSIVGNILKKFCGELGSK